MLAVGVHLHGAVVVIFGGKAQPGLERARQPQVDRQINEAIAVGAADGRRFVAAAIVDNDIIVLGVVGGQFLDHGNDAFFLIISGDDDE